MCVALLTSSCKKAEPELLLGEGAGQVTDAEGYSYKTVRIGQHVWMAENLRTARYANGDVIPEVLGNAAWLTSTTGATCIYDADPTMLSNYGRLYNFLAVEDGRGLCPYGWHVPSLDEWHTLALAVGVAPAEIQNLNLQSIGCSINAGSHLKSTSALWWDSAWPHTNATGFSAMPGGLRGSGNGFFLGQGEYGAWWTSTAVNGYLAYRASLSYANPCFSRHDASYVSGLCVRCIKD